MRTVFTLCLVALAGVGCDDGAAGDAASGGLDAAVRADAAGADAWAADAALGDAARRDAMPDGAAADAARGRDAAPADAARADAARADAEQTDPAVPDAAPADAAVPDAAPSDAAPADAGPPLECPPPVEPDYACDVADAQGTCPGGICLFGACIGPIVAADRWDACGDGVCDACEGVGCPVDCGPALPAPPARRYDAFDETITVQVHGFSAVNDAEFDDTTYGAARSAGGQGRALRRFLPDLVDGEAHPEAPDQLIGVEYCGRQPAAWMTPEQIAAVEAFDPETHEALPRYAHVVAFFVRHRMAQSGARYVSFVCHSMGCHVIRYLLEHDLEGLASDGVVARWYTVAGVLAGARLARLFDNPTVRDAATLLALNTSDFVHMHPDYVVDDAAVWDHRPREANSPLLAGILVHHTVGTDPRVSETANIVRLLDLNNPGDEPNDGIMYSLDEFFHDQAADGRFVAADGRRLRPTRSHQHLDHFLISDSEATGALGAAALFGGRKVYLTLDRVELLDDREQDGAFDFSEEGQPPAELAVEVEVAFEGVRVHQQHVEDRSPEVALMVEGEDRALDLRIFEGPVPDALDALDVHIELLEVDAYPRFGVLESLFDAHERLVDFRGSVALRDDTLVLESQYVRAEISVRVVPLY